MPIQSPDPSTELQQRQRALARWENEGGHALPVGVSLGVDATRPPTPEMTNTEIVALRVRVIALENVLMSLLATAPEHQLDLVREMAEHILPRPGYTPHPLTIHAAKHMVDLIGRSRRFRRSTEIEE